MEAIILAGGFGTRLRPLTYTRAKALLPILNKPMISYLVESLPKQVDKIIVAVNYRKDQIEEFFNTASFNKEIIVNDEPKPLGTAGAVKFAEKHITDSFFVINADIICSLNLSEMIDFHKKNNAVSTISLWPVDNVSEFGVVDVQSDGNVTGFVEKPKPEDAPSNLINAGAYLLEYKILDYIERGRLISMEKEIFPQIIRDTKRFYGFKFEGYWIDVGRINSYLNVHQLLLKKNKLTNYIGKHCSLHGEIVKSSVGDNVRLGKESSIYSSVIFNNASIGDNVVLDHCIVGENSFIDDDCHLTYCVIGDHEKVKQKSSLEKNIIWNQPIPHGYPNKQIGNVIGE
ncbi:MAG: NDP-sugar synthase [Thermoplasmatota archaeon]